MKRIVLVLFVSLIVGGMANAGTVTFEDLDLAPESFWYGAETEETIDSFQSGFATFNNYNDGVSWANFGYSNRTDTEARDYVFMNTEDHGELNAITGGGHDGSEIYAVAYLSNWIIENTDASAPTIELDEERKISGAYFTNTNVAYYVMLEGDDTFDMDPFDEDDWFKVIVTGFDESGSKTGDLEFYLANDGNIVDTWKWVDFEVLGPVKRIEFAMESSDIDPDSGDMNTPSYFCMDSFNGVAPQDSDSDSSSSDTCFISTLASIK